MRDTPPRNARDGDLPLRFSFKYLDATHPVFDFGTRGGAYFRLLLARLKELSSIRVAEFCSSRATTLRIHPISFDDARVSVRGFGLPGKIGADEHGWQFALSANEHGRVHGFLIEDTFFVRWLDPEHRLYSGGR